MNLLPIEIYFLLVAIIPLGVCFAQWKYSARWKMAVVWCAAISWIYFNLSVIFNPPDNGFVNAVYLVSGWFWLLPLLGIIGGVFRFVESRLSPARQVQIGSQGYRICAGISIAVLFWNIFGRMSEERAILEARQQLRQRGYEPAGREIPAYHDGHWTIRYPDNLFGEIRLTRNGSMSWIGGPG